MPGYHRFEDFRRKNLVSWRAEVGDGWDNNYYIASLKTRSLKHIKCSHQDPPGLKI